jgi:hypothetical protein
MSYLANAQNADMELTLDTPATYRIRVKGYLDSGWSDRLGGLTITPASQDEVTQVTTLVGQVVDQAALAGVLSALYTLHLPLLSVEYLSDTESGQGRQHGISDRKYG